MKKLILLLLFIPLISFGQTQDALDICWAFQTRGFIDNKEADKSLGRIMEIIGVKKNFVLIPCSKTDNVIATSYKGIRYIFYDKEFMRLINSRTNDWSSLTILAHEVGHHLNGHVIDLSMYFGEVVEPESPAVQREQELEADEFAGFIMAKLGAPLDQVQDAIAILTDNRDDTYSTHPSQYKRLNSLMIGYNKAIENSNTSNVNNNYIVDNSTISVEQYYNRGASKNKIGDYSGAIEDYNKAIEINPDFVDAYLNRGASKDDLGDYYGAIEDYNKAIELEPYYFEAYSNRGVTKDEIGDYSGAIADYSKAIQLNPDEAIPYSNRGVTKDGIGDYYGAIADYSKAIQLNPDFATAYLNRGYVKSELEDYYGAIEDYTKAIEINPYYALAYYNRGIEKSDLEDYYGAISDFTKAIELNPNDTDAYYDRGISKELLGDLKGACEDWKKAANLGDTDAAEWVKDDCY